MDKTYPRVLRTKEDVEYVINNFPREVWHDDIQELYMMARGYYVVGTDPIYKDIEVNGTIVKTLAGYKPISSEERSDVMEHDDLWENASLVTDTSDTAEFDYKGKHYYAEFRVIEDSIVGQAGIDIDWLEDILFEKSKFDKVLSELDAMQEELNEMEDDDNGQKEEN